MEINGYEYNLGKMNAMTQFHVSRRLMPVVASMAGEGDVMSKILGAVGELTDEDSEYIIGKCLADCTRKKIGGKSFVKIMSRDGQFMFDDIGMVEIIKLTMATLEENLSGFFTELRSNSLAVEE
jgi:hypothetical protein